MERPAQGRAPRKVSFMSRVMLRLRTVLGRFWRLDAPLTATALLMLGLFTVFAAGSLLDSRLVLGAPIWLKPAKFAASIAVYCWTMVWLFGFIPERVRTRRIVSGVTVAAMLLEMGIIGGQAARGTTSHFNVSTPLDAFLFAVMGIGIVAQTFTSVALAVALFRQRFEDRALGWAVRLGLAITIAGAFLGGVMTRPTSEQAAQISAGRAAVSGAHTVGAADGGPGIAVTGWSREHGDVRVSHFLGLHAMQALPLLLFAARRLGVSRSRQPRLVLTFAGSYAGLLGISLWQALRGQSLIHPDSATLFALVAWAGLTAAPLWAWLRPSPVANRAPAVVS
jgi:hypothetical protein